MTGSDGLHFARRIRTSPYFGRVESHGVSGYSVYNHMLLQKHMVVDRVSGHAMRFHTAEIGAGADTPRKMQSVRPCHAVAGILSNKIDGRGPGAVAILGRDADPNGRVSVPVERNLAFEGELTFEREVTLHGDRDSPIWVCVTTEDGHRAWSSPIYFVR